MLLFGEPAAKKRDAGGDYDYRIKKKNRANNQRIANLTRTGAIRMSKRA